MNPAWSPYGKFIAYLSDKTGEYEVYTRPQMGGLETRITSDGGAYRYGPVWSPDSKKLLYWDKLHKLWWVSVEDKKPVQVDQGDYGNSLKRRFLEPAGLVAAVSCIVNGTAVSGHAGEAHRGTSG